MRSIWKGSLTFGLVNVPVKVYSATEDQDVHFRQVHGKDLGRIHYSRVCDKCGEVVPFNEIEKAYESESGQMVMITQDDFDSLPADRSHEIEIVEFVPTSQIDPLMLDRSYYLEPSTKSPKAYVLLRQTLEQTDRIAIAKFALRQKQRLAVLRVRDNVLVVQTLLWPDEVRAAEFSSLDNDVVITDKELKMAISLVDSFAADFNPDDFVDEYRLELQQMIEAKLDGDEAFPTAEADSGEDAEVLDLLAALQRSVERQKSGSTGASAPAKDAAVESAPASTVPVKKTATKEPAAKPVRKTAASSTEESKPKARRPA